MREHYWSHYHVWSAAQDTVREMTKEEREHQETLKGTVPIKTKKHPTASETGAKKIIPIPDRNRFPMTKPAASAAAGAPSSADEDDDSMKPPKQVPMNRVDTRTRRLKNRLLLLRWIRLSENPPSQLR